MARVYPYSLFGIYIIELGKFFQDRFVSLYVNEDDTDPVTLQVYYGTPQAAFRELGSETENGQVLLPMLNYLIANQDRKVEMERTVSRLTTDVVVKADGSRVRYSSRAPMHFNLTFQLTLYNNNLRERDVMMHKIHQAFPQGEMQLTYYPDLDNHPDVLLFMPCKLDTQSIVDETEYEGLDTKETRDQIRTTFNINVDAMLPYDVTEMPLIEFIEAGFSVKKQASNPIFKQTYRASI